MAENRESDEIEGWRDGDGGERDRHFEGEISLLLSLL